ncbi:protein-methionine-sulfoxide reductase heme-binding subunit MsrQ [Pseudooceanicola aestuarii]|uniref:protein-methionine-sulfoxide reductase heme-binding subunit MsrQ n=1 Tax=Pseudooceanicola aestuarii TaxID=2697319 RepID=UPI0013D5CEF1|nr:protein-methionine-sulfoxide reductase heme-binding subunit MsrQ [Pseudooceanicola aestuarii]
MALTAALGQGRDHVVGRINGVLRRVPAWPLYIVGAVPPIWLFISGVTGGLGVDPVKVMEHQMGEWGLWLLIAGLAVTPLRRHVGLNLLKFRRAIGLLTFFYILGHLLVWLVLDVQILSQVWADILKRPYITVGMAAFVLMIPLAVTSNNRSIRRLGSKWRKLHKAVYAVAILGALHFVLLVKGFQLEPLIYLAAILFLLALRVRLPRRRRA